MFLNSSALFTRPSISKGSSRVVDLFGYLDEYNYSKTEEEADLKALTRDWKIVGLDIHKAMGAYGKEQASNTTKNYTT